MNLFFHKDEIVSNEGLNVRPFINETYCTITKAAIQDPAHEKFLIKHSWEILNISLLVTFDDKVSSQNRVKMMKKSTKSDKSELDNNNNDDDNDDNLLSTSAKAFAILSHASNTIVNCLTKKHYFYKLAKSFLEKQISKKNKGNCTSRTRIYSAADSENGYTDKNFQNQTNTFYSSAPTSTSTLNSFSTHDFGGNTTNSNEEEDDEKSWLLSAEVIISRLATIFQNIINNDSDNFKASAQLLLLFLPFTDNLGVYDLFLTSLSMDTPKPNLFHHLLNLDLVDEIVKIICNMKVGNKRINDIIVLDSGNIHKIEESNIDQPNLNINLPDCVSNNLYLLSFIARNKYFIQSITENDDLFPALSQLAGLNDIDTLIKNSLWKAICSSCNESTIKDHEIFLKTLFYKAVKILSEPYVTLNTYHTYAMDFLGKIMKYFPDVFIESNALMLESIIEIISRLIAQFPDSTNLQSSIARFIITGISYANSSSSITKIFSSFASLSPSTSPHSIIPDLIIKKILPLVIFTAQSKHYRSAASASCAFLMYRISLMSPTSTKISQFCNSSVLYKDFMNNFMNDYKKKLGSSYGGNYLDETHLPTTTTTNVSKNTNEVKMNQNHAIVNA